MKSFFVLIFLALIAFVAAKDDRHNLILGERQEYDRLLKTKVVSSKAVVLCTKTEDYTYKHEDIEDPATITFVGVIDQYTNGKGGYATLKRGGPDYTFITLRFTSQRNRGYHFVIDIYGQ
ncbi:probable salivary secreted peptide [Eurosta solidaginis]|uniref:probable salivary secreted peptide n=1 Tax=Eurosta solidaginis TaxID=178769 RepID=UPI0035305AC6